MKIDIHSDISLRLLKFFVPFIISGLGLLILYLIIDENTIGKLFFLMLVYFIPPLGKESLIPIGVSGGNVTMPISGEQAFIPPIDPFVMAISIAFVDIMVALFLVWNYDLAKKIPLIGDLMQKVEKTAKGSSKKYGWVKKLEFIGIILFVIVPFQGSGGFIASIVGRLIGMKPWNVFTAIFIGSFLSTFLVAYFADILLSVFVKNFLLGLLIFIVLIIIFIIAMYYKNYKNNR